MEMVYEEYSSDRQKRYRIYKKEGYFEVVVEQFCEAVDIQGYIEPSGYSELLDGMVHHVGSVKEGICLGRELLKNL